MAGFTDDMTVNHAAVNISLFSHLMLSFVGYRVEIPRLYFLRFARQSMLSRIVVGARQGNAVNICLRLCGVGACRASTL